MQFFSHVAFAALALLLVSPAFAHAGHNEGAIEISNAYARAMPPAAKTGGGYFTISNTGAIDDVLLMVTSPAAGEVQLHQTVMEGDVMKMGPAEVELVISAGGTLSFEPGRYHLMFIDVVTPFAEGDEVPLTLHFEHAGPVELWLPVGPIGASEPPMASMRH